MNKHCLNMMTLHAFILIFMMGSDCMSDALKPCREECSKLPEIKQCDDRCSDILMGCHSDKNVNPGACGAAYEDCKKTCYHPLGWMTPAETWGW